MIKAKNFKIFIRILFAYSLSIALLLNGTSWADVTEGSNIELSIIPMHLQSSNSLDTEGGHCLGSCKESRLLRTLEDNIVSYSLNQKFSNTSNVRHQCLKDNVLGYAPDNENEMTYCPSRYIERCACLETARKNGDIPKGMPTRDDYFNRFRFLNAMAKGEFVDLVDEYKDVMSDPSCNVSKIDQCSGAFLSGINFKRMGGGSSSNEEDSPRCKDFKKTFSRNVCAVYDLKNSWNMKSLPELGGDEKGLEELKKLKSRFIDSRTAVSIMDYQKAVEETVQTYTLRDRINFKKIHLGNFGFGNYGQWLGQFTDANNENNNLDINDLGLGFALGFIPDSNNDMPKFGYEDINAGVGLSDSFEELLLDSYNKTKAIDEANLQIVSQIRQHYFGLDSKNFSNAFPDEKLLNEEKLPLLGEVEGYDKLLESFKYLSVSSSKDDLELSLAVCQELMYGLQTDSELGSCAQQGFEDDSCHDRLNSFYKTIFREPFSCNPDDQGTDADNISYNELGLYCNFLADVELDPVDIPLLDQLSQESAEQVKNDQMITSEQIMSRARLNNYSDTSSDDYEEFSQSNSIAVLGDDSRSDGDYYGLQEKTIVEPDTVQEITNGNQDTKNIPQSNVSSQFYPESVLPGTNAFGSERENAVEQINEIEQSLDGQIEVVEQKISEISGAEERARYERIKGELEDERSKMSELRELFAQQKEIKTELDSGVVDKVMKHPSVRTVTAREEASNSNVISAGNSRNTQSVSSQQSLNRQPEGSSSTSSTSGQGISSGSRSGRGNNEQNDALVNIFQESEEKQNLVLGIIESSNGSLPIMSETDFKSQENNLRLPYVIVRKGDLVEVYKRTDGRYIEVEDQSEIVAILKTKIESQSVQDNKNTSSEGSSNENEPDEIVPVYKALRGILQKATR